MPGEHEALDAAEIAISSLAAAQEHEPDLEISAAKLLTFNGYLNALADLAIRSQGTNDRDSNASMNVEVKVLKLFAEIHTKVLEHQLDSEGTRKLQELLDQMGRRDSGATTSFDGDFTPPEVETDKGTN